MVSRSCSEPLQTIDILCFASIGYIFEYYLLIPHSDNKTPNVFGMRLRKLTLRHMFQVGLRRVPLSGNFKQAQVAIISIFTTVSLQYTTPMLVYKSLTFDSPSVPSKE